MKHKNYQEIYDKAQKDLEVRINSQISHQKQKDDRSEV